MSDKTFKTLGIVAAISVVLAIVVGSIKPTVAFDTSGIRDLLPDIEVAGIHAIEIQNGADSTRLERAGPAFTVASKHNYPASNRQINSVIEKCVKIRTTALLTSDAADHESLGISDAEMGNDGVQVVKLFDADGKMVTGLIAAKVGNPEDPSAGYHVRLLEDDKVYDTAEYVQFQAKASDYVEKSLLSIQRDDVAKASVEAGDSYSILNDEGNQAVLQDVPEGKKAKPSDANQVLGAAVGLAMTDFLSEVEAKDLVFESTYTVETKGKARYAFEIAKKIEKKGEGEEMDESTRYFVRAKAKYFGPPRESFTVKPDDSQEQLDEKDAMLQASDGCREFNQRHQSWVYEVGSWKAEQMCKPLADLVEEDDGKPTEVEASHILVAYEGSERCDVKGRTKEQAMARAAEVLGKVKAGEQTFEELAKEFSDGPSGPQGGSLGMFKFVGMAKPFSEAAFALEVGAVSDVVETQFGFHVIKRTK